MNETFPPRPQHASEIHLVLQALGSCTEIRTAVYVSSPLTTGARATELGASNTEEFRRRVIEPNREDAARFVRALRTQRTGVVIDPGGVEDFPGWTQSDYRVLWGQVIERYADTVVFRDGWHHSSGCAYEFFIAVSSRVRMLREDLSPLPAEEGKALLAAAIDETSTMGGSPGFLLGVLEAVDGLTPS